MDRRLAIHGADNEILAAYGAALHVVLACAGDSGLPASLEDAWGGSKQYQTRDNWNPVRQRPSRSLDDSTCEEEVFPGQWMDLE